ncbi:MAG: hypothetical protein Tsb0034_18140 [Ekhidna sp.]
MLTVGNIVSDVEQYAVDMLEQHLPASITYHSINHTKEVVDSAREIAFHEKLSQDELDIVLIAAWFHDVGYIHGCEEHEQRGAEIADEYLKSKGYPDDKIEMVKRCILATKMPQEPSNKIEKVMCDADLMHLAGEDYFEKADLLHQEIEKTKFCKITENEWLEMNNEFLGGHCFFTDYARKTYESAVKANLKKIRERLNSWKKAKK